MRFKRYGIDVFILLSSLSMHIANYVATEYFINSEKCLAGICTFIICMNGLYLLANNINVIPTVAFMGAITASYVIISGAMREASSQNLDGVVVVHIMLAIISSFFQLHVSQMVFGEDSYYY